MAEDTITADTRICTQCAGHKLISEFGRLARRKDGINTKCLACERAYHSGYRNGNRNRVRQIGAKWRGQNQSVANARSAAWVEVNPARQRAAEVAYRANNPLKRRASCRTYRQANTEKEQAYRKIYAAANLDKLNAKAAARRARKLQATPSWVDHDLIATFYAEAARLTKATGIAHHVDHIVPLQSKWVCGLHCPANLEVRVGSENISKGNRFWPDMGTLA